MNRKLRRLLLRHYTERAINDHHDDARPGLLELFEEIYGLVRREFDMESPERTQEFLLDIMEEAFKTKGC